MEVKFVIEMVLKEERVGEIERVLKRHFDKYGWPRAYRAYTTSRVEEESSRHSRHPPSGVRMDERARDILRRAGYTDYIREVKEPHTSPQIIPDPTGIILYHGTPSKNVSKILEEGIMPRTAEFCHKLIEEKGEGAEEYAKKYALSRCLETTGRVSLSGSREYAIDNCRAGLESEVMLRASREGRKESEIWRDIKKEVPCSLVEVEIPREVIPRTGGGRWEGRPIGEILDSAYEVMKEIVPMTWEESKAHFQEFTFDEIPRGWIKAHHPIE